MTRPQDKFMGAKQKVLFSSWKGPMRNLGSSKPAKVEVILTEVVVPVDSLPPDTLFVYQLIARIRLRAGLEEIKSASGSTTGSGEICYHKDFDTVGEINLPGHSAISSTAPMVSPFHCPGSDDQGDYFPYHQADIPRQPGCTPDTFAGTWISPTS